jgi:DNA-binding CsgD family transcriptional regulator
MPDPKTLSQRVFEGLSTAMQTIFHPSFYEHTLSEIGVDLGREVLSNVRQSYLTAPVFHQDDYLRCLEWLKTHWGWNHDVEVATKGLLNISIPHCPFETFAVDNPHICQIEAGMLGGIAGSHFNYCKVEVCRGDGTPPKDCSLTVHLERTAQSVIIEGPTFPLTPPATKQTNTVDSETRSFSHLSPREREILRLIGEGLSDREIANALQLSVRTVEGHTARIRTKTKLGARRALIRLAVRMNPSL